MENYEEEPKGLLVNANQAQIDCFILSDNKVKVSDPQKAEANWNEIKIIASSERLMRLVGVKPEESRIEIRFSWGSNAFALAELDAFQDMKLCVVSDTDAEFVVAKNISENEGYFEISAKNDETFNNLQFFLYDLKARKPLCCTQIHIVFINLEIGGEKGNISKTVWVEKIEDDPMPVIQDFSSTNQVVERGEKVDLNWETRNADYCDISPGQINVAPYGSYKGYLINDTMTIALTAVKEECKVCKEITVYVKKPTIITYDAEPCYKDLRFRVKLSYETKYCDNVEIVVDIGETIKLDPSQYEKGEVFIDPIPNAIYTLVCKYKDETVMQEIYHALPVTISVFDFDSKQNVLSWEVINSMSVSVYYHHANPLTGEFSDKLISRDASGNKNFSGYPDFVRGEYFKIEAEGVGGPITRIINLC